MLLPISLPCSFSYLLSQPLSNLRTTKILSVSSPCHVPLVYLVTLVAVFTKPILPPPLFPCTCFQVSVLCLKYTHLQNISSEKSRPTRFEFPPSLAYQHPDHSALPFSPVIKFPSMMGFTLLFAYDHIHDITYVPT